MKRYIPLALVTVAMAVGACSTSAPKKEYEASIARAERDYSKSKEQCDKDFSGNAEEICEAEAKAQRERAKASAEAAYEDTPEARYRKRLADAEADYKVAMQRCEDLAGDNEEVCEKEAKAVRARSEADAKTAYRTDKAAND